MRAAFDADDVTLKNIALRQGHDEIIKLREAAQGALALLETITAAEVEAQPVQDIKRGDLGELFNRTEAALRDALARVA